MMRSLFSGVAGLKTHQTKMDVIGNNISNVNTVAYKGSSIVFADLMSQTTQRASGANAATGTGGINARQIGLGVKSGAININITGQGSAQSTGNPFDLMLTGENFFVVNDGTQNLFTRDGSFYVDGAGNLAMTSTGYNVMGWKVDPETGNIKQDTVAALRIMSAENMTYPPEATSLGTVAGILDKNDTDVTSPNGKSINLGFYDALGYYYTAKFVFKQSDGADKNNYSVQLDKILDSNGDEVPLTGATGPLFGTAEQVQFLATSLQLNTSNYQWNGQQLQTAGANPTTIADLGVIDWNDLNAATTQLDANGNAMTGQQILDEVAKVYGYEGSTEEFLQLATITDTATGNPATPDSAATTHKTVLEMLQDGSFATAFAAGGSAAGGKMEIQGRVYDGTTISFDADNGHFNGMGGVLTQATSTLYLSQLGGNFSDIVIDFSGVGMYDNKGTSTVGADSGDKEGRGAGRRLGDMIGVSIQNNGMIYASYDNGMTKLLGQIATAAFANASGLEKQGDNMYAATLNSGAFDGIGVDVTANGGYISTGQLEMSNVDLSSEFTEMITTQRGFQANSRIITVSDTLLEELTNLKR